MDLRRLRFLAVMAVVGLLVIGLPVAVVWALAHVDTGRPLIRSENPFSLGGPQSRYFFPLAGAISGVLLAGYGTGTLLRRTRQERPAPHTDVDPPGTRAPGPGKVIAIVVLGLLAATALDPSLQAANARYDTSTPVTRQVTIEDKERRITKTVTSYVLIVPNWHAGNGSRLRVPVSRTQFAQARTGQRAVVVTRDGRLGLEYLAEPVQLLGTDTP